MCEDSHAPVLLPAHFIQKFGDPLKLHYKRFSACGCYMEIVVIPLLQSRIIYFVELLHFPFTEVQFFQTGITNGIRIATVLCQTGAAAQRTCEYGIKHIILQLLSRDCGFFFKTIP